MNTPPAAALIAAWVAWQTVHAAGLAFVPVPLVGFLRADVAAAALATLLAVGFAARAALRRAHRLAPCLGLLGVVLALRLLGARPLPRVYQQARRFKHRTHCFPSLFLNFLVFLFVLRRPGLRRPIRSGRAAVPCARRRRSAPAARHC